MDLQQLLREGVHLGDDRIRLEPLSMVHAAALAEVVAEDALWKIVVTTVPHPDQVQEYIGQALAQREQGSRFAFAVIEQQQQRVIGTTSYHDILAAVGRVEIGYTWYAKSVQRTWVNTTCKYLLLKFAFEQLHLRTVGLRTDMFNFASQQAIERIGAKKDGVLRGMVKRKDGSIRDVVMYSLVAGEWETVSAHLQYLLHQKYHINTST